MNFFFFFLHLYLTQSYHIISEDLKYSSYICINHLYNAFLKLEQVCPHSFSNVCVNYSFKRVMYSICITYRDENEIICLYPKLQLVVYIIFHYMKKKCPKCYFCHYLSAFLQNSTNYYPFVTFSFKPQQFSGHKSNFIQLK